MSEETERKSSGEAPLDLESLRDLDFGPRWSTGSGKRADGDRGKSGARGADRDSPRREGSGPAGRDRRPARKRPAGAGEGGRGRPQPVEPVVSFTIYPEDEPFDLLVQSIRSSLKVHELFELTRLILDKPDRMVVVVHPLKEESPPLAQSIPDGKLFLGTEAALAHAAQQQLPTYFEEREEEVEPPSGNFSSVFRCRKTQALLPPRNYHLYASLLREHQRTRLPGMSVEAVERQLEPVADEEVVQEWIHSMSRRSTFVSRASEESGGAEPVTFPDREKALQHLMRTQRDALVRESRSVRLPARDLLEHGDPAMAGSFRAYLEEQQRFPLESSHQVRAKLRKARMQLFKQGRKGITYVSAVRRKHRPAGQRFADSVERILAALDGAERKVTVRDLPGMLFPEVKEEEISADEKKRLAQDLKWLKSEGYLLEYANGTLEVQPVEKAPAPAEKASAPAEAGKTAEPAESAPPPGAPAPEAPAAPASEAGPGPEEPAPPPAAAEEPTPVSGESPTPSAPPSEAETERGESPSPADPAHAPADVAPDSPPAEGAGPETPAPAPTPSSQSAGDSPATPAGETGSEPSSPDAPEGSAEAVPEPDLSKGP